MFTDIVKKKQGDGKDSWIIKVWSGTKKGEGDLLSSTIEYEDPKTKIKLFTDEEIEYIRKELGL